MIKKLADDFFYHSLIKNVIYDKMITMTKNTYVFSMSTI